jgi:uncharacterized OB-fold protein
MVEEKHLLAYKCKKCGQLHYPFRMRCKKCGNLSQFQFDTVPLPNNGKIVTFTYAYNLPGDFAVQKLGLAIVELENGMKVTGQLKTVNPKIGKAVHGKIEVVRNEGFNERYGIVFY